MSRVTTFTSISIHALREEGDRSVSLSASSLVRFLSTPSARRATEDSGAFAIIDVISIHALREEGDLRCAESAETQTDFYPRPPRGGRRQW